MESTTDNDITLSEVSDQQTSSHARASEGILGTVVDNRFRIESLIGQGGMSSVYRAQHFSLQRPVAVKILHHAHSAAAVSRFQMEAKAISSLSHQNIASFIDFGVLTSGNPYLAIEYLEGQTLASFIASHGPMTLEACAEIFLPILEAIEFAHKHRIIHRDIKPSNVMIGKDANGAVKVTVFDFGIARQEDEHALNHLTQTGDVFGSPLYMSPEQCTGVRTDERSDIYSLGCVLFEMLVGKPPFEGVNSIQTLNMHVSSPIPSATSIRHALSNDVDELLKRLLAKNPQDRYAGVSEVAFDFGFLADKARKQLPVSEPAENEIRPGKKSKTSISSALSILRSIVTAPFVPACLFGLPFYLLFITTLGSFFTVVAGNSIATPFALMMFAPVISAMLTELVLRLPGIRPEPEKLDWRFSSLLPQQLWPLNQLILENLINAEAEGIGIGQHKQTHSKLRLPLRVIEHNNLLLIFGDKKSKKEALEVELITQEIWSTEKRPVIVIDSSGKTAAKVAKWIKEKYDEQFISEVLYVSTEDQPLISSDIYLCCDPLVDKELSIPTRASVAYSAFVSYSSVDGSDNLSDSCKETLKALLTVMASVSRPLFSLTEILSDEKMLASIIDQAEELATTDEATNACKKLRKHLAAAHLKTTRAAILDRIMLLVSDPKLREIFRIKGKSISVLEALRTGRTVIADLPKDSTSGGSEILASLICAYFAVAAKHLRERELYLTPPCIYLNKVSIYREKDLLDYFIASEYKSCWSLRVLVSDSTRQLPPATAERLLSAAGTILVFRIPRADALKIARVAMPAEALFSVNAGDYNQFVKMAEVISRQKDDEYVLRLTNSTAGLFEMCAPGEHGEDTKLLEMSPF